MVVICIVTYCNGAFHVAKSKELYICLNSRPLLLLDQPNIDNVCVQYSQGLL